MSPRVSPPSAKDARSSSSQLSASARPASGAEFSSTSPRSISWWFTANWVTVAPPIECPTRIKSLNPNADTALMLGLAHTLLDEGLHDDAVLERYCTGFERFAAYLDGSSDAAVKDAEWAAARCDIAAEDIRALARRTEMDGVYLSRVARDGAPVKVVLAVVKATELTPRRERSGKRGGKAPQHWVRVLQQIDPALTEAQCRARIESAKPLVGDALREIVDQIGKSYGELGSSLSIDKTHVLRAVHERRPTGKGIQAVLNLLYEKAL